MIVQWKEKEYRNWKLSNLLMMIEQLNDETVSM